MVLLTSLRLWALTVHSFIFFRHHLSALPVILSDPSFILCYGGVSVLGIIYYRHCRQLFLHLRLKIFIWVQLSVNICVIAEFSGGGIYKTKITGKDILKFSRGRISKTISTGRDVVTLSRDGIYKTIVTGRCISTLSRGGIFKPSIQAEILQKSQEVEFIKPSVQADILQHYQEVEFLKPKL